jgi:hypothetical protein
LPRHVFFALALLGLLAQSRPAGAVPASAPKPAPPCTAPAMPGPIATRFAQLGGIPRFGCAVTTSGPVYVFRSGRIEAIPAYGPNATYAALVDASDIVHLYVSGTDPKNDYDQWLVRLTYDGSLINQVKYTPGNGDVGGTCASDILVHPGGRHGTFEIAMEGCFKSMFGQNSCVGWSNAVFMMDL